MLSRHDIEQMLSASYSTRSMNSTIKTNYDDFAAPLPYRNNRIIVQGRVLFVNSGWLAELSPYFASKFFGEKAVRDLELSDVIYDDFLELLRTIFLCPTRKPVTVSNISIVLPLAYRFDINALIKRCEYVIAREIRTMSETKLFEMATLYSQCDRNSPVMTELIHRMSSMSERDLTTAQFNEIPGDVVADVFAAKMKRSKMESKSKSKWCCFF